MILIKDIKKEYGNNLVLKNINLTLPNTGLVVIEGDSGSGKSTLLNIIGGIITPSSGEVVIDGVNLQKLKSVEQDTFRIRNIGYVFQSFNLLPLESVFTNVKMPLDAISNSSSITKNKRVDDLLKELEIHRLKRKQVNKLSGGEKQRVAIAKALVNDPKILLCDEPTGALDTNNTKNICEILSKVSSSSLVIVVTHDVKSFQDYADRIIKIEDGRISSDKSYKKPQNDKKKLSVVGNSKFQKRSHLPLAFKLKHAFHKITSKKWRFLISNFMLSLSLTGVGLSLIITTSLKDKIQSAFSSLLNGNQILVTPRQTSLNDLGSIYSASEVDVLDIANSYSDYVDGVGVTYLVNFEDFFKDGNGVYYSDGTYNFNLPSLSARSFNDYRWIDSSMSQNISPKLDKELEKDEVVLGLSYIDMINITYNLKIKRSFESLENYIYHNDFNIALKVRNDSWQYSDEQIYKVVGVLETSKTCTYHTRKLWNREIFEDAMRFPSNDGTTTIFPWEMNKVYYLSTKNEPGSLLDEFLKDDSLYDYVFERTNSSYNPLLCGSDSICDAKRICVYNVDKNTLKTGKLLDIINKTPGFKDYFFLSNGGYVSYGSMLIDGFAKSTFFSTSLEKNEASIDADTMIDGNNALEIDLPKGVLQGYFLNSQNSGVKFSSKMGTLLKGELPKDNTEIVISKAMANSLDNGHDVLNSFLYISSKVSDSLDPTTFTYKTIRVKIVGIADSDKNIVYHNPNWTISFFRDCLGVSSFDLCPNAMVIELDDTVEASSLISKLDRRYLDYSFISPLDEISKSVDNTLDFIKLIVILFSVLAGTISILLLVTLILLNILENQHEVKIMKYSGITDRDISSQFVVDALLQTFIAFIISTIQLVIIDYVTGKAINDMLGSSTNGKVNIIPFVLTFLIAMSLSYLIAKIIVSFKNRLLQKEIKKQK